MRKREEIITVAAANSVAVSTNGQPTSRLVTRTASEIEPRPIDWLWKNRIPIGKLTVFGGHPKLGKSLLTCDFAARVSNGFGWPDMPNEQREAGRVLIVSAEDDADDTIVPRLIVANAELEQIDIYEYVADPDKTKRGFALDRDLHLLDAKLAAGKYTLVVLDPLTAFMGKSDSHKNAEVRAVLAPLRELAGRHRVAILGITHLSKASAGGERMAMRFMGSLGFTAAARAVWAVCQDRDDPRRRLVLNAGGNCGPDDVGGLAYTVDVDALERPFIAWEADGVEFDADEYLANEKTDRQAERLEQAVEWLLNRLAKGPESAKTVTDDAKQAGITARTLRRAKDKANIGSRKLGGDNNGAWAWHRQDVQYST